MPEGLSVQDWIKEQDRARAHAREASLAKHGGCIVDPQVCDMGRLPATEGGDLVLDGMIVSTSSHPIVRENGGSSPYQDDGPWLQPFRNERGLYAGWGSFAGSCQS